MANRCRGLLVIKRFDPEKMPDGSKHYRKGSNYGFLCGEFKSFIDTYRKAIKHKSFRSYYKGVEYSACFFLLRLQKKGINTLDAITEESVFDIFSSDDKIVSGIIYFALIALQPSTNSLLDNPSKFE